MKMMRIITALGLAMGAMACENTDESVTTTKTETPANTETQAGVGKTTETQPIETKTAETRTSDTHFAVGIAECDDYVVKMTECTKDLPEGSTELLATLTKGWKEAASTPQGRITVASACKNALSAARSQFAGTGCTF